MFENVVSFLIAWPLTLSGATLVEPQINEPAPMAIYRDLDFFTDGSSFGEEYLTTLGNNSLHMRDSTSLQNGLEIRKIYTILQSIIADIGIDSTEQSKYLEYLTTLRSKDYYTAFLNFAKSRFDSNICNAVAFFLAQIDYKYIGSQEEDFIFTMLQKGNVSMQEYALDTILAWDNISDLEKLKSVKIANRFLQDDLELFIDQKA